MAIPAGPASAASCSSFYTESVTAGFLVRLSCTNVGRVDGYGSTLAAASIEAREVDGVGGSLTGAAQNARFAASLG